MMNFESDNEFYFKSNVEVVFYVPEQSLAVQVSYSVLQDLDTRERELNALAKLNNFIPGTKCILITNSEETEIDIKGIHVNVIPARKWLLMMYIYKLIIFFLEPPNNSHQLFVK